MGSTLGRKRLHVHRFNFWRVLLLAAFSFFSWSLSAKPEYFVVAVKYGATDCSFCHLTAARGEAVNERGQWLVAEAIKRDVIEIDVNWLTARGAVADEDRELVIDQVDAAVVADVESIHGPEPRKPFDHSTQWGEWPSYNGNLQAQKYSPLPYVNLNSVDQLELQWVWEAQIDRGLIQTRGSRRRGGSDSFKANPLVVNGSVYVRTRLSTVVAIDALTGEQKWEYDPGTRLGPRPSMFGWTTRGLGYHVQSACVDGDTCERLLFMTSDGWLIALDAETGKLIESFGVEGKVDLTQGLRRPIDRRQVAWSHSPLVCNDVVVVGSQTNDMSQFQHRDPNWNRNLPLGDVRGFDPVSGEQVWVFKTVPQEGEFGVETWGNESWRWMGNTNVWSTFSCDPELNHVYLPVTAPTNHMYGGDRPGDNLFGTSVVAVNLANGERVWHFQITHHDIWDYDLPAPPVVADVTVDGKPRKVVAQVTKVGYLFVFDRITGEPVWPVEEREVPASTLVGEVASPTQPHPTKPPAFELQGFTEADLNDLTPELLRRSKELLEGAPFGPLYTPSSESGALMSPGVGGGANWSGASFDPDSGQLFVSSRRDVMLVRNIPIDRERMGVPYRESWRTLMVEGIPITKPPWSTITAYNLNNGEIAWQIPNGEGPKSHRLLASVQGNLPALGEPWALAGILALPDLLLLGHNTPFGNNPSTLKALSKATGEEVWSTELIGSYASTTPVTYALGGRQYVLLTTGGPIEPSRVLAFALDIPNPEEPVSPAE